MPILIHYTSLENAISIVRSGVFLTAGGGDACLNAFVEGRPASRGQEFQAEGVALRFDWSGPVRVNNAFPLETDVLHDDLPWRAVVPVGSTQHLRIVGLDAKEDAWIEAVGSAPWYCLTARMKSSYRRDRAEVLKGEIEGRIATRPPVVVRSRY